MPTLTTDTLIARAILASNRPVRANAAPTPADRMSRHESLGVWFDPQHAFLIVIGCHAIRAITDQGRFCWLVRQTNQKDKLSFTASPYDITPEVSEDDGLNIPYQAVTELAAALRRGHVSATATPEPAMAHAARTTAGMSGIERRIRSVIWMCGNAY